MTNRPSGRWERWTQWISKYIAPSSLTIKIKRNRSHDHCWTRTNDAIHFSMHEITITLTKWLVQTTLSLNSQSISASHRFRPIELRDDEGDKDNDMTQFVNPWCMLRIPILPIIKLPFNQVHLLKWTHDNQPISYPRLTLANERQQNPNCRNLNRQTYVMFSINMQRRLHTCDGRPTRKKKSTIVARN